MSDRTLLSEEIRRLCQNKDNPLLSPLSEDCLKAASYDIRVGATAIKSKPGGHEYVNFRLKESITIEPEQSCTFYSLEKLHIPANIQALLFNRYHWVTQRLNFDGGVVEPGYKGYLFLTVTNVGDSDVTIRYEEPLVTAVFIQLERPAEENKVRKEERLELDKDRLPPLPAGERSHAIKLTERVTNLEKNMKEQQPQIKSIQDFTSSLVFATIAGIIAGTVVVLAVLVLPKAPAELSLISIGVGGIGVILLLLLLLIWRVDRKIKGK